MRSKLLTVRSHTHGERDTHKRLQSQSDCQWRNSFIKIILYHLMTTIFTFTQIKSAATGAEINVETEYYTFYLLFICHIRFVLYCMVFFRCFQCHFHICISSGFAARWFSKRDAIVWLVVHKLIPFCCLRCLHSWFVITSLSQQTTSIDISFDIFIQKPSNEKELTNKKFFSIIPIFERINSAFMYSLFTIIL